MSGYSTFYAIPKNLYDGLTKLMTAKQLENIRTLKIGQINFNSGKSVRCTQTFKNNYDSKAPEGFFNSTGDTTTGNDSSSFLEPQQQTPKKDPSEKSKIYQPYSPIKELPNDSTSSINGWDASGNESGSFHVPTLYNPQNTSTPIKSPRGRGGRPRGTRTPGTGGRARPNIPDSPPHNNTSIPDLNNTSIPDLIEFSPNKTPTRATSIFNDTTIPDLSSSLPKRRRKLSFSVIPGINIPPTSPKKSTPKKKSPKKKSPTIVVRQIFDSTKKKKKTPKKTTNMGTDARTPLEKKTPKKTTTMGTDARTPPEILTRNIQTSVSDSFFETASEKKKKEKKLLVPKNETLAQTVSLLLKKDKKALGKSTVRDQRSRQEFLSQNISDLNNLPITPNVSSNDSIFFSKSPEKNKSVEYLASTSKSFPRAFKKIKPPTKRRSLFKAKRGRSSTLTPKKKNSTPKKTRRNLGKELDLIVTPPRSVGLTGVKAIAQDIERSKRKVKAPRLRDDENLFVKFIS
jgi:hypothetical protein